MSRDLRQILEESRTVAVVGASRDPGKPSGHIPYLLKHRGYHIIPVNPKADEVVGEPTVASLLDIKEPVDVVDVFRPAEDAPEVARQAVAIGARVLWLQLGIVSEEARRIAEEAGLDYVEDTCMGRETVKLHIGKRQLPKLTRPATSA